MADDRTDNIDSFSAIAVIGVLNHQRLQYASSGRTIVRVVERQVYDPSNSPYRPKAEVDERQLLDSQMYAFGVRHWALLNLQCVAAPVCMDVVVMRRVWL